jgi:hypothetical protein
MTDTPRTDALPDYMDATALRAAHAEMERESALTIKMLSAALTSLTFSARTMHCVLDAPLARACETAERALRACGRFQDLQDACDAMSAKGAPR